MLLLVLKKLFQIGLYPVCLSNVFQDVILWISDDFNNRFLDEKGIRFDMCISNYI